jgi:glycosyltransferase involved in cell wall biosynthesis
MRIMIATDAWHPQVNGVLRTLTALAEALEGCGETVRFLTPEGMHTIGLPSYRNIRLGIPRPGEVAKRVAAIAPDVIHVATEGSIGHLVRRYCVRRGRPFTTSFHTRFADYVAARWPVPEEFSWAWLRWFHNAGRATMASTPSLMSELEMRGFSKVARWPRGVDADLFRPDAGPALDLPRPVFLSVGRISVEKNLDAFLALDLPGTKVVVGDGPARAELAQRFPQAVFLGEKHGKELAGLYASADVFVFPSRTDTFGLVMLEALSSGTPVAGYPVSATCDVVAGAPVAALDHDLRAACLGALRISRHACREYAQTLTWKESARCFLGNLIVSGACMRRRIG